MSTRRGSLAILLKDAAAVVPGAYIVGDDEIEVAGLEYHSKLVQPDSLFVAVVGFKQDGNQWIDEAISRGAAAVVTEKQADRPVPQMIVTDARAAMADLAVAFCGYRPGLMDTYGVTGTNGKTTSCFLIKRILEAAGRRVGLITSLVYDTGHDQIPASRTTPESLDMFRLLHSMARHDCTHAVIEISSHALALHRVKNLDVRVAAFTNITRDHLDFHADMDDYLAAKARLLDMVDDSAKWAVINRDCDAFRPLFERGRSSKLSYSLDDHSAHVHMRDCRLLPGGSTFELCTPHGARGVSYRLTGRYNL